jgi:hypothetical protein
MHRGSPARFVVDGPVGWAFTASVRAFVTTGTMRTSQKYLHMLPEADDRALVAFESVRRRSGA